MRGYEVEDLISPSVDEFSIDFCCGLCQKIVNDPLECSDDTCGLLYCRSCCSDQQVFLCKQCHQSKFRRPSVIVIKQLRKFVLRCQQCNCGIPYDDMPKHVAVCQKTLCSNELCSAKFTGESCRFTVDGVQYIACSKKCKKVTKFAKLLHADNEKAILQAMQKMLLEKQQARSETLSSQLSMKSVQKSSLGQQKVQEHQKILFGDEFSWDQKNSSKEIHFSQDFRHAFLKESNYLFRTVVADRPFMDGHHYWEIVADSRTEHELKVGVTTQQRFNLNTAFCDNEFGFGFYGTGQLRHGSTSQGKEYGVHFKKKGILGCYLDMDNGTLNFIIDGVDYGVAFQDKSLTRGPVWPAVSLLHKGGLTLISGIKKPEVRVYQPTHHQY